MSQKPGGVRITSDGGYASPTVTETSTCAHCQRITNIPSRRKMMDCVDVCRACMALVCLECAGKPCRAKMRQIEQSEEAAYRRDQYRKMLGV